MCCAVPIRMNQPLLDLSAELSLELNISDDFKPKTIATTDNRNRKDISILRTSTSSFLSWQIKIFQ